MNSIPIHEHQCWVSYVRYDYVPAEGAVQGQEVWETPMGIYCTSASEYDRFAAEALRSKGCRFLGSVTPKPTSLWFTTNGYDSRLAELAPKVDRQNWARWHQGTQVSFNTPIIANSKEAQEKPLIITEHEFERLPDQSKVWPPSERQWIDPKLKEFLFDQAIPEEHQRIFKDAELNENGDLPLIRTYFICDAVLRRKITGIFDLDIPHPKLAPGAPYTEGPNGNHGNIEIRSLYKGKAQEELKEVAPYLIDLTLPFGAYDDDNLVPDFHKELFSQFNEKDNHLNTGIFIRSMEASDQIWTHLRKFTRVQDENGKWFYWRFWAPESISIFSTQLDKLILSLTCYRFGVVLNSKKNKLTYVSNSNFMIKTPLKIIVDQNVKRILSEKAQSRYSKHLFDILTLRYPKFSYGKDIEFINESIANAVDILKTKNSKVIREYVSACWLKGRTDLKSDFDDLPPNKSIFSAAKAIHNSQYHNKLQKR